MEKFINKIIMGDCLEVMKGIPDKSVDSIVTDPPYHLVSIVKRFGKEGSAPAQFGTDGAFSRASKGFMGKTWDGLGEDGIGIANNPLMWAECLRVLKPGGHLLAFSGTRTYHRMASAIEDAGFEVRDMIEWVYGSGFPKSLNIGKAVDKLQGNNREVVGISKAGSKERNGFKGDMAIMPFETKTIDLDITKGTSEWEGWGTALKPSHEPICMARKPLAEKTVAENCLKYGTGGINIDESRVEYISEKDKKEGQSARPSKTSNANEYALNHGGLEGLDRSDRSDITGRFPANLIHDNSEEVRECFPESKSPAKRQTNSWFPTGESNGVDGEAEGYGDSGNASRFFKSIKQPYTYKGKEYEVEGFVKSCKPQAPSNYNDEGSPARYFKSIIYQAKASKSERNKGCEGLEEKPKVFNGQSDKPSTDMKDVEKRFTTMPKANNHPTVKPIALCEYLIKMVTKPGGIVLDPFAGSGSTLVAAKQNGFQYIGIELTEEYIPIIEARLLGVENDLFKDIL